MTVPDDAPAEADARNSRSYRGSNRRRWFGNL